jgi:hypothetical protein
MTPTELHARCIAEMDEALVSFGTYSYDDKGPREVMDIEDLEREFRAMTPEDAVATFRLLMAQRTADSRGRLIERLASAILVQMQEWDELWAVDEHFLGSFL